MSATLSEQINQHLTAAVLDRTARRERWLTDTLRPLAWHERCRIVVEQHPDGSETARVRDWSEVTYAEFTRTMQGLVRHRHLLA